MTGLVGALTVRRLRMLIGAITITMLSALTVSGVEVADGALDRTYDVTGLFSAAGQGLLSDSDVKIHGVNIGRVSKVELERGRALVHMEIDDGERIPVDATATIRPKTLFGEKFVDIEPGPREGTGPFLDDGDRLRRTVGGFELEKVLTDAFPLLRSIDPVDLATIVSTLADGGEGLGPAINRTLANFAVVAEVQARHNDDTDRFLRDLAALTEELAARSPDIVSGARDLNVALPELNRRSQKVSDLLDDTARLSNDLADIFAANQGFFEKGVRDGGKALEILDARRAQLPGLIVGLRQFVQLLAEIGRIPLGDGTNLAAVKNITGGGSECGRTTEGCAVPHGGGGPPGTGAAPGEAPDPAEAPALPQPKPGARSVLELVEALLR